MDDEAITRFAASTNTPFAAKRPRTVGILHLPGGQKIYTSRSPHVQELTGREEGTIRGINFERWEDDGSPEFEQTYERVENGESFYG